MFNLWKLLFGLALPFYAEGDDDGGVGDPPPVNDPKPNDDRVAVLEANLNGVVEIVRNLANSNTSLQQSIQQLSESLTKANEPKEPDPEPNVDDADLETMSRRDLINLINGNMDKRIKESLNPLTKQISGVSSKLDEAITSVTVKDFQGEHPDLMEWKSEIAEIFKMGRASTVADAYSLARSDNPEKVKSVDLKFKPTTKKADVVSLGFKGFPGGSGKNARMTATQAAEAAWEEATSSMPGIEQFLNSDLK
jgi:hypothetical protein